MFARCGSKGIRQNMVKPLRRSADPHKHDDHDGVEVEYIDSNGWVERRAVPFTGRRWVTCREDKTGRRD